MREILLTRDLTALVDDSDFAAVSRYKWHATCKRGKWYAARSNHKGSPFTVFLHRWLLNAEDGVQVDHKDGDGLNCQRENLRIASRAENSRNATLSGRSSTGFKGVRVKGNRCYAYITVDGRHKHLGGGFDTKEEAAKAYDEAAMQIFGEFAKLNFPRTEVN